MIGTSFQWRLLENCSGSSLALGILELFSFAFLGQLKGSLNVSTSRYSSANPAFSFHFIQFENLYLTYVCLPVRQTLAAFVANFLKSIYFNRL